MMRKLLPFALGLLLAAPALTAQAQTAPMDVTSPRQPYTFFPQAGTLYDDLYLQNFYDLDGASGLLDWSGSDFTLSGETGEDSILRSFAEQNAGVPVFAALDGTVSAAVYSDPNDHSTAANSAIGNYVILDHGAGQQTGYFSLAYANPAHPDPRYTPLKVGQYVKAGTQIGLAASSGNSTGPHLHFQSSLNGQTYEPFAGPARTGPSWWVTQPAIHRGLYLDVFNMDAGNVSNPAPSVDLPRQGTFVTTTQAVNIGAWTILHNLPANSAFRLRWLRPDGSVYRDSSGAFTFTGSTTFQRTVQYYWNYTWTPGLDQTGTWHLELTINNQVVQTAPFFVVAPGVTAAVHAPYSITAMLDPVQPSASDVIFCRVATAPGQDGAPTIVSPDSQFVTYHYQWYAVSGEIMPAARPGLKPNTAVLLRDVVSAGHADAIPWGIVPATPVVRCTVTPVDSRGLTGPSVSVEASLDSRTAVQIAVGPNNAPRVLWHYPDGLVSLWNVNPDGSHTDRAYGPYSTYGAVPIEAPHGWSPVALAVGPDNAPRVLWNNLSNGTVALWNVNAVGDPASAIYGPYADWSAVGLAVYPNGASQILWDNTDGTISLWQVNANSQVNHVQYGPYSGWTAKALALGADSLSHILWTKEDGTTALWSVSPSGVVASALYGPFSGWNAVSLTVGADNKPRLLWTRYDGTASLWIVNANNGYSHTEYGPYSGWTASSIGVGADNKTRVVWTNVNGAASVWNIDTSGVVTSQQYGL